MAVFKKGDSWVAQVFVGTDEAGRKKYVSRSLATQKEARDVEAELKVAVAQGKVKPSGNGRTLADALTAYVENFDGSPTTLYGYRLIINRLPEKLTKLRLRQVTTETLDRYYRELRKAGKGNRTIRNTHALLRAVLGQAVRWGWIGVNPALNAKPGQTGGPQGKVAKLAEIETLLAAADEDLRLAIRLAVVTGARRSELCGLDWADVDFNAGTLKIERATVDAGGIMHQKTTKTHASRTLPLDAATLALLKQKRGIGPLLNTSPITLSRRLTALCASVGITGLGWHSFRHFTATFLLGSHDVKTVAARLGHANPNVTLSTYAHQLAERDQAAADAIGGVLG